MKENGAWLKQKVAEKWRQRGDDNDDDDDDVDDSGSATKSVLTHESSYFCHILLAFRYTTYFCQILLAFL